MIERVLENWLDNASERTFQIPFCYMLQAEGYTVLHMTRHCAMELGKDIIAIDKDGVPCAFQLKGAKNGKISIGLWREINSQITDLVYLSINHPCIDSTKAHRSFLVTNGELEEEVVSAIADFNRSVERNGHFKLKVIVRGQLIEKSKSLGLSLWPSELSNINNFLEMFLLDGCSLIPKEKLSNLFESILVLTRDSKGSFKKNECLRRISSCALLCSAVISPFANKKNYVTELEAWTIYLAYTFAFAERWKVKYKDIFPIVDIAFKIIYNLLSSLCDELMERKYFFEGDPFVDKPLYRVRMTLLVSLMSLYALLRRKSNEEYDKRDEFIKDFCQIKQKQLNLWGEAAIPQFLVYIWYLRTIDSTPRTDFLIEKLINSILKMNDPDGENYLANPYFNEEDIFPYLLGLTRERLEESFRGESYTLEGLMHLFVRRNWKQEMKLLWPEISKFGFSSFIPDENWQYYLWRSSNGVNISHIPPLTKRWDELLDEANESNGEMIPEYIKNDVLFFVLFLIIYPHRCRADVVRWVDSNIS